MKLISLGSLLRETGNYSAGLAATHTHDVIVATNRNIADAKMLAGNNGNWQEILLMMLSIDNRIPFTPYDPEQVDC